MIRNASIPRLLIAVLATTMLAVALACAKRGAYRRAYAGAHGHIAVNARR